ncbi:hypothetical protein B296_00043119 [Ensete ventricosum]|uniref:Uncharacterized protein n=1 Tax=Ensete ventricosum TaxID=4639 RepID=A0A426ZBI8_ENSVE|nr:hypothetical protein B296_00043119 [Ensete ventricosum]
MQGHPPTASPQVRPTVPTRGDKRQRPVGDHPQGQQPIGAVLVGRSVARKGCLLPPTNAAPARGQSAGAAVNGHSHRLRRGSDDDDGAVRVMEGLGHPFEKRTILPLRI